MSATAPPGAAGSPPPRRDRTGWLEQRINLTELFSFLSHFGLVYFPIDTRRPLREVLREIDSTPVAAYARWPQVLGMLAAILFGLEAVTGLLLAFYYRPTPEAAFGSTLTIVRDLPFGSLIHQMHQWGAYLLIVVIGVRLVRLFWDGLYRAPRELVWFAAVALTWLAMQLDFTGRLLTWDVKSYWAAVRGLEVVWSIPIVGPILAFLLGGRVMNEDVLIRFYVLHIAVLPLAYAACIYLTVATLRKVGLSDSAPAVVGGRTTTFREHRLDLLIITLFLFAALVTLGRLAPFRFLAVADPYSTPAGARPPWYMLAAYTVFQHVPGPTWIPGVVMLAVAFGVLLLPLWAPAAPTAVSERRLRIGGIVLLALWLALVATGLLTGRR
jgi:quinol-cytochrome oxidoreductase complex cytochrome b subunit